MKTPAQITDPKVTPLPALLAGLLAIAATAAHADYTVINDDLYPDSIIQARHQAPDQTTKYAVTFSKERSPLTAAGQSTLDSLIPQMRGANIRIVGRPDAIAYKQGNLSALAERRAVNIRIYLEKNGIPHNNITLEVDKTANPQQNSNGYPSEIYITRPESRPQQPAYIPAQYTQRQAEPIQPTWKAPVQEIAPQYTNIQPIQPAPAQPKQQADDQLIAYINEAVQSGKMAPSVAIKLMREMLLGSATSEPRPQPIQPPPPPPQPVFVEKWVLDQKLSLRDNIDAWSKAAGWNPSTWNVSNNYQINRTSTLSGGFPDVLREIAESTGLNICAKKREKYVRITDPTVSCKE